MKTQNENLQLTMQKLVKSVEKLSAEKQTMVLQMEQQALSVIIKLLHFEGSYICALHHLLIAGASCVI